jgi:hypothetical protein
MSPTTAAETIMLKNGFVVSLDALQLAWHLEERGFELRLDADGGLLVWPRSHLTVEDDHAIRVHRTELIALTNYIVSEAYL